MEKNKKVYLLIIVAALGYLSISMILSYLM
jgi:hypothetical protein